MKIYSFNVNGIRSVFEKGFLDWIEQESPEIICLQEIKADSNDLHIKYKNVDGYYSYFNSAQKKGYAGTAVYTKIKPNSIEKKLGLEQFDNEGRMLRLNFNEFTLFNLYTPNGARDKSKLPYKFDVYKKLLEIFEELKNEKVILAGDFNIAHEEIDLYHSKNNKNNTMFTREERDILDKLINLGYVDTFRHKYSEKEEYTWWGYMPGIRERNIGWRIDYVFVTQSLLPKMSDAFTRKDIGGSDHCPIGIDIDLEIDTGKTPVYSKETLF